MMCVFGWLVDEQKKRESVHTESEQAPVYIITLCCDMFEAPAAKNSPGRLCPKGANTALAINARFPVREKTEAGRLFLAFSSAGTFWGAADYVMGGVVWRNRQLLDCVVGESALHPDATSIRRVLRLPCIKPKNTYPLLGQLFFAQHILFNRADLYYRARTYTYLLTLFWTTRRQKKSGFPFISTF